MSDEQSTVKESDGSTNQETTEKGVEEKVVASQEGQGNQETAEASQERPEWLDVTTLTSPTSEKPTFNITASLV